MTETYVAPKVDPIENLNRMIQEGASVMGYHHEVDEGPNGVYLTEVLRESAFELEFNGLEREEPLSQGASDTHHEVCFAKLEATKSDGEPTEALIAVKHFDDALEGAVSECDSLLLARRSGFDTLAPVAIVKESETSSYLITLFRPDIKSLDNEDWSIRPGEEGHEKVVDNLRFIAESMGEMHAKGLFHGDAQPKNFMRSDEGNMVVADLEIGCTIAQTPEEHVTAFNVVQDSTEGTALHDLRLMWTTLNRQVGLRPENRFLGDEATVDELYSVFRDHFVTPYLKTLEDMCDPEVFAQFDVENVIAQLDTKIRDDLGLEAPPQN